MNKKVQSLIIKDLPINEVIRTFESCGYTINNLNSDPLSFIIIVYINNKNAIFLPLNKDYYKDMLINSQNVLSVVHLKSILNFNEDNYKFNELFVEKMDKSKLSYNSDNLFKYLVKSIPYIYDAIKFYEKYSCVDYDFIKEDKEFLEEVKTFLLNLKNGNEHNNKDTSYK